MHAFLLFSLVRQPVFLAITQRGVCDGIWPVQLVQRVLAASLSRNWQFHHTYRIEPTMQSLDLSRNAAPRSICCIALIFCVPLFQELSNCSSHHGTGLISSRLPRHAAFLREKLDRLLERRIAHLVSSVIWHIARYVMEAVSLELFRVSTSIFQLQTLQTQERAFMFET